MFDKTIVMSLWDFNDLCIWHTLPKLFYILPGIGINSCFKVIHFLLFVGTWFTCWKATIGSLQFYIDQHRADDAPEQIGIIQRVISLTSDQGEIGVTLQMLKSKFFWRRAHQKCGLDFKDIFLSVQVDDDRIAVSQILDIDKWSR